MNLNSGCVCNPVAAMFGVISLERLPIQLTPELEKQEITITTNWRAAAPEKVEVDIAELQEKVLRGTPGAVRILARTRCGQAQITIEFTVGMDMQRALLEVLNRLNQVPLYPDDAEQPVGLAAAIVGGLSVSTVIALVLLPSMLRMGESSVPYFSAQNHSDLT